MWINFICNENCRGGYFEICDFESRHILIPPESLKNVTQPCWAMALRGSSTAPTRQLNTRSNLDGSTKTNHYQVTYND
jgi:hypothetical protein